MRVTIYDVAKQAGVGIGTVSRVINNSPHISPKTRDKVLKVIKQLKYQPYVMAQGLARKKTNTIACIVPYFTGYFYFELLNGVQQALSRNGYDLILYSVDLFEKKEDILKRTLRERRVDGVLVSSMTISDNYAAKFIHSKIPVALVDGFHQLLDSITIENHEGAYLATSHLLKLGHIKIGMINGCLNSVPAKIRLQGYKQALIDNNITLDEQCIFNVEPNAEPALRNNDGFNKLAGYIAMKKMLALRKNRPTAVFISSDIKAAGAIKAIQEHGLKIPDQIAIVGFDGIELSEYLGLTTMKQPMFKMGDLAVKILINKIQNGVNNEKVFKQLFHPQLVVRETCGASLVQADYR
ncbi:MAG TPA: LacI family transcriptional regulator [bacterium]|nr:LacI family transcriptional regulator [bacterium]